MNKVKLETRQNGNSEASSHQQIEARAHQLYLDRGGEAGREMEDWLQAEREVVEAQMADDFANNGMPVGKDNHRGHQARSQG